MSETCIRFGEFGARVMIEDREVEHYAIAVDLAKKEVTCWIASEANKMFSVVWLELDAEYPSAGSLYLDGHYASIVVRLDAEPMIIQDCFVSDSSSAPFLFSPLVVTDDDAYLETSPSHSIGEIKLVISRTTEPKIIPRKHRTYAAPLHLQKVHERSKKATAHRVGYGSAETLTISREYSISLVETLVTFIFKYRPLEMLRANGIVPRNPEPLQVEPQEHALDTPLTSETSSRKGEHSKMKRDVESGSEIDEDSLSTREKALLAEVQRCQAEVERIRKVRKGHLKPEDSDRPKKKLKKELEDKIFFTPGEIIDLT